MSANATEAQCTGDTLLFVPCTWYALVKGKWIVCYALSTQLSEHSAHRLLYTYLHPPSGADRVSWESWQLATAIHGEGEDSVIFCSDIPKVMTTLVVILLF